MAGDAALVEDYLATLEEGSAEVRFLRSVPWIAGPYDQHHNHILKGLAAEASRFAELPAQPLFSLLTPLWNTPPRLLDELILSLRCQSWQRWELILVDDGSTRTDHHEVARRWAARDRRIHFETRAENAGISAGRNHAIARSSGDFLAILDHDDLLHPQALGTFVRHLHDTPDANFLFSNEAKINEASDWVGFYLYKPPFDVATLLRVNCICHFTAIRRDLLFAAERDGMIFRPPLDGVEDHDLFLRVALTGQVRPVHVPFCLYYWRMVATSTAMSNTAKPDLERKRQAMLDELIPELYPGARWTIRPPSADLGNIHTSIRITALARHPRPRLLVMVPFRDTLELTLLCLESVEKQEHELDVRVILINNRSQEPATIAGLAEWVACPRRNRYELVDHDGAFNYARMHNQVIDRFSKDQDLLLFLNNDVELNSPDCLQTLATHVLADRECGFAGIRLNFPDDRGIQHGGIKIHGSNLTFGLYPFFQAKDLLEYVSDERVAFAVIFACAMIRREVFDRLGRLDEVLVPNGYGDIDIQARALALGFRNFYFGTLVGSHHEAKSRGKVSEEFEFLALHKRHAQVISDWKLRGYTLSLQSWTTAALPAPSPEPAPPSEPVAAPAPEPLVLLPPVIPLRYVLADRLNQILKLVLGPLHVRLKAGILRGKRSLRATRVRRQAALPTQPNLPKRHAGRASDRLKALHRK